MRTLGTRQAHCLSPNVPTAPSVFTPILSLSFSLPDFTEETRPNKETA